VQDFNKDGKKDLLLAGNFYPWKIQLGKSDANKGLSFNRKWKRDFSLYLIANQNFVRRRYSWDLSD
jgi:hypothetical protein